MAKKYVWLKLKEDFFQQRTIKKLRKIAGGDTYTIIYLKLQLLSLTDEGKLFYEGVEDTFAEEMALAIDEDVENIKVTLMFLEKNGLIEKVNADEYTLLEVMNSIGSETAAAERMRKMREAKKLNKLENKTEERNNVTQLLQPVTNSYTEKEEEKEIDKDKDDNTNLDKLNKIEDEKKLDEPKEEKEVRPMVSSSIEFNEFKNDLKELKDMVVKSTGINKMLIDNTMLPSKYRDINIRELINKIKESKFLLGELDTKPNINHFSVRNMIDRIMADAYKDKQEKKAALPPSRRVI